MNIYLAGPMTNIAQMNAPAFHGAAAALRADGHFVMNPAEFVPESVDRRVAMATDLAWICNFAEAVAVLPGWRESRGALAEVAAATAIGIPIVHVYSDMPPAALTA